MNELEQLRKDNLERHRECGRLRREQMRARALLALSAEILVDAYEANPARLMASAPAVIKGIETFLQVSFREDVSV